MEGMFLDDIALLENILCRRSEPTELILSFLMYITDNFSETREIGRGSHGVVYKGEFNNMNVALKKLTFSNKQEMYFEHEIASLMTVHHKNIVQFLGYCNEIKSTLVNAANPGEPERRSFVYKKETILCFEYISNGSLKDHIHDELRGLAWPTRYNILKGICHGLDYLHNEKNLVHICLNPGNILVDNLWVPKIANVCSASRLLDGGEAAKTTIRSSPWGYAAPEFSDGVASFKADIYSLGIIIIELVTGARKNPYLKNVLTRWRHRWNKSDETLKYQQVAKCIELAILCQNWKPSKRPSISEIISELDDVDGGNGTVGQVLPRWNDLLWIEPPEVFFDFQTKKQLSCSLELHNETAAHMAFFIKTGYAFQYHVDPTKGVVQPCSSFTVNITLLAQEGAPERLLYSNEFTVKSTRVNAGLTAEDIATYIFSKRSGNTVDKTRLHVVFDAPLEISGSQDNDNKSSSDVASTLLWESTNTLSSSSSETADQESESKTLEGILINANAKPCMLSYPFIKSITRNFSEEIGRGGFGVVYMGYVKNRRVAVKKLSILQGFFDSLFMEEINCLLKTNHSNVVRFLGYCWDSHGELVPFNRKYVMAEVPQRLLCFEYVPNGNLQTYLKDKSHKNEWKIRYQMIRGICHGLNYLHEQRIVHLDLKPENIMLDACLEPKITDFGISKCFDEGISRVQTKNIRGTLGSTAPETINSGEITLKSDIYGLGVIIIKLLTGSNKYDFEDWHTSLDVSGPQVEMCVGIAQRCVSFDQKKRPTMGEIMEKLNQIEMV